MVFASADCVKETTSTAGIGTLTLSGAAFDARSFVSAGLHGKEVAFRVFDPITGDWEVNTGTFVSDATGDKQSRSTPLSSSNGGSLVSFAGNPETQVYVVDPADYQYLPGNFPSGSLLFAGVGGFISQNNANLFWDNTNKKLGVGTTIPAGKIHAKVGSTEAMPCWKLEQTDLSEEFIEFEAAEASTNSNPISTRTGGGSRIVKMARCNVNGTYYRVPLLSEADSTQAGPDALNYVPCVRMSLDSSNPEHPEVGMVDNLYIHPFQGNVIPLYDATQARWVLREFNSVLTQTNAALLANKVYDVYLRWTGSAVAVEMLAWTSTTTEPARQRENGLVYKNLDKTRLYIGSVHTDALKDFNDISYHRGVWNYYHRHLVRVAQFYEPAGYTYNSSTVRAVNNSPASSVMNVLCGMSNVVSICMHAMTLALSDAGNPYQISWGLNSSSAVAAGARRVRMPDSGQSNKHAILTGTLPAGLNALYVVEYCDNATAAATNYTGFYAQGNYEC